MSRSANRPNVLFIMADQFRHDWMGCAGNACVRTPHLDRLAAEGVRFTQCTTNNPVCAPARIGLAAGRQPVCLGSTSNGSYLPRHATTYYQRLRDDGYRVGCVGKLDLAKPDKYNGRHGDRPCCYGWGFTHPEEVEGKMHAGMFPQPQGPYGFWLQERGLYEAFHADYRRRAAAGWSLSCEDSVLPTEAFADAYVGRRAAEWLDAVPDDFPWHYFVSFPGPHDPFDPPTEYADRYRDAAMPDPIVDELDGKSPWVKGRLVTTDSDTIRRTRRQYSAAVELIDDHVGLMLAALERRGMLENTVILFSSDHGEMLGDHGLYTKCVPYEGSVRVPLIAAGPGIAGGRTSDVLVELIDLNPTMCELAGLPRQEYIDAESLVGVLDGTRDEHRTETASMHRSDFRLVRTREHKLIQCDTGFTELYDLQGDPDELENIADAQPDLVRQLTGRMYQRFNEALQRR